MQPGPIFDMMFTELSNFQNAFSDKLAPLGFDFFPMLVVDFLHEFELGIWKSVFIHLLQILESVDESLIAELDRQ